ncbi:hypothetical protein BC832DRAFT_554550 [Gaertneriomyces semiglobifer]|nr:hypothetical protein BC832DRAFT_554550 [Gaertneriomyces semiglobifer]
MKFTATLSALALCALATGVTAQTNTTNACIASKPFDECLVNTAALAAACAPTDLDCACRTQNLNVFCYVNFCGGVASQHPDYPVKSCQRDDTCSRAKANITTPSWAGNCATVNNGNTGNGGNGGNGGNAPAGNDTNKPGSTENNENSSAGTLVTLSTWGLAAVAGIALTL